MFLCECVCLREALKRQLFYLCSNSFQSLVLFVVLFFFERCFFLEKMWNFSTLLSLLRNNHFEHFFYTFASFSCLTLLSVFFFCHYPYLFLFNFIFSAVFLSLAFVLLFLFLSIFPSLSLKKTTDQENLIKKTSLALTPTPRTGD